MFPSSHTIESYGMLREVSLDLFHGQLYEIGTDDNLCKNVRGLQHAAEQFNCPTE